MVLRRTKETTGILDPLLNVGLVVRVEHPNLAGTFWKITDKQFDAFTLKETGELKTRPREITIPYVDKYGKPTYSFIKELVHIPKKIMHDIPIPFDTDEERQIYNKIKREAIIAIKGEPENIKNALVHLLRLRQAAIHPWLLEPKLLAGRIDQVLKSGRGFWLPSNNVFSFIVPFPFLCRHKTHICAK